MVAFSRDETLKIIFHLKGRQKMKKMFLLLCIVFLGVGIIFASTASCAKEQVVLEFPTFNLAQGPVYAKYHKWVFDVFEKENPGVKLNAYGVSWTIYADKMMTRAAAGDLPDILMVKPGLYIPLLKLGLLEPLSKWMDKTDIKTAAPILNEFPYTWYDGKTYIQLECAITYQPIYLTWVYKESGVGIPTTPEEFNKAMEKLTRDKNGDGTTDQYGFGTVNNPGNWAEMAALWEFFLVPYSGVYWIAEDGTPMLDDPRVIKAIQYLDDLYEKGFMPKGTDVATYRRMFGEGVVATGVDGPFVKSMIDQTQTPYFDAYPAPWSNMSFLAASQGEVISSTSRYKEEAWKLLEIYGRQKVQARQLEITALQPPRKDAYSKSLLEEDPWWKVFRDVKTIGGMGRDAKLKNISTMEFQKILTSHIEEVLFTDKSAEDAMKAGQKEIMDVISKG